MIFISKLGSIFVGISTENNNNKVLKGIGLTGTVVTSAVVKLTTLPVSELFSRMKYGRSNNLKENKTKIFEEMMKKHLRIIIQNIFRFLNENTEKKIKEIMLIINEKIKQKVEYFRENLDIVETYKFVINETTPLFDSILNEFSKIEIFFLENFLNEYSENFDFSEKLGSGSFGTVYKTKYLHGEKMKDVAVKVIEISKNEKLILNEIECVKFLKHDFIVRCYDVLKKASQNNVSIFFVMELADQNLKDLICNGDYQSKHSFMFSKQIINAIHFIHQKNWIHRDIKPENILIFDGNKAKLSDFGTSKNFTFSVKTIVGSPKYMAP